MLLGVDPSQNFTFLSWEVYDGFSASLDQIQSSHHHVAALLERNVRVLIYVGTYDFDCNWVGNEWFTVELEWGGRDEFAAQPLREWKVDVNRAGRVSARGLTFATVEGGGRMAAHDRPREALELVDRWMTGESL
jgi:carboxypeptidase C (cathepsin A)